MLVHYSLTGPETKPNTRPRKEWDMERIKRLSRRLKVFFIIVIVLLPCIQAVGWAYFNPQSATTLNHALDPTRYNMSPENIKAPLTPASRLVGFIAGMIPTGLNMLALFYLVRLFGLYAQGLIFTRDNVRYIRLTGYVLLIRQAAHPVHQTLETIALTINNPPGQRMIQIGLTDDNLSQIVVALIIILVSWIMDEGRKLKEEEALVI